VAGADAMQAFPMDVLAAVAALGTANVRADAPSSAAVRTVKRRMRLSCAAGGLPICRGWSPFERRSI
jgi:hypothetical protein